MQKALKNLNNMSDAFFVRLVPSEKMAIKADDLVVSLRKVSSHDIKGLSVEEGGTNFKLPGNLGQMGDGNVNAKVFSFWNLNIASSFILSRGCVVIARLGHRM